MAQSFQRVLKAQSKLFKIFSDKAPVELKIDKFSGTKGVIDFSHPQRTSEVLKRCLEAKVPLVCGTTGFGNEADRNKFFAEASQQIPIVLDSNFSVGIELLCQVVERSAQVMTGPFFVMDIHHQHKKDAPSGTSFKIENRILSANPKAVVEHKSIRAGENPGEHIVRIEFGNECLEFRHQAYSRDIFAEGAIRALEWVEGKKAGLYSMKEVMA